MSTPGLLLEIGGALLLFWYPIGTVIGAILLAVGWHKSNVWLCTGCEGATTKQATRCRSCGAAFSSE